MRNITIFIVAAFLEISGCYAFWVWLKLERTAWWLVPGAGFLALFAYALTWTDTEAAGRAYAAYGGVYIAASLTWLWVFENTRPDRWDILGASLCLVGAATIIAAPR